MQHKLYPFLIPSAAYNVVDGDPAVFVRSGLGYFLTSSDHLPEQPEIYHALVWKRYAVLSRASDVFIQRFTAAPQGNQSD